MAEALRFEGKVAIVTGAGGGLGRSHALLLASRGCKVVVNDLGGAVHGGGRSSAAADKVVEEIKAAGGHAVANYDSVEDGEAIVKTAIDAFGGVDILINNAGILRDVSFQKMTQDDWDLIYKVHVLGAYRCTKAAWDHMREKGYGRILVTASAAGIYGNFGQANYSMAKLGLVGFANTLAIEGRKKNVHVNAIAPIAGSRMTETILPKEMLDALKPEYVSPLVAWLCHESCKETGGLFEVGGGFIGKLRWERAVGRTWKLGSKMTPESIADHWSQIAGFEQSTHPTDVTSSMAPIMDNVQAGPSKGGNEFVDLDVALSAPAQTMTSHYDERDLSLYALGIGAAHDPLDGKDLRLVYELNGEGFLAFPTFGVIPAIGSLIEEAKQGRQAPGLHYGFDRILHGEQYLELKRPLPPKAKLTHKAKVKEIFDKGKNAVVVSAITTYDESGDELAYNEFTTVVRGAGGWGGDRGPTHEQNPAPERAPDATIEEKTAENQALLYRLTGDINPLHVDPGFAQAFGFQRPILHGLCTFGFVARHVIKAFAGGDPRKFKSIKVRFADSVFPGETLVTEMWKDGGNRVVFRCKVKERDKVVISNAAIELYEQIPQPKAKAKPAAAGAQASGGAAPAPNAGPIAADVFRAIELYLKDNPQLASKVATVFAFRLSNPNSDWLLDLKNGSGAVKPEGGAADCTLELSDADFLAMCTGKADPMKLFSTGKLKIGGNVMASQKLNFLQKMDPKYGVAAYEERVAKSGGATPPQPGSVHPAGAEASAGPISADVFRAIELYLAETPDAAAKIATVFQFKLSNPNSEWLLDLKNGKGAVKPGSGAADCALELSDADFLAMCTGKADPMKLFTTGKLKISGNVMASQKLNFLQKMDPKFGVRAYEERTKAGGGAAKTAGTASAASTPAAAASTKPAQAPAIFAKLGERLKQNAALAKEIGAIVQFKTRSPDGAWTVDLHGATPSVKEGVSKDATTTLTLADEDVAALVKGPDEVRSLYQHGKLRVDGDVRVAHKLAFFKGL